MKEAIASPDHAEWRNAMKEMESFSNNVWDLVELLRDSKAVGSKWVFKQNSASGMMDRYQARLVAQGFSHRSLDLIRIKRLVLQPS